ncbi:hypothetical protein K466DRAFT_504807 [Polyporus arcularius HHB13444]|uniref:Uncharacterized protein n=1 Tax=Polyporus arcularius HHB13444 TaxID=1314778 RepID=A0A5C3P2D0_9APHY|nr:hypothetical protein K466DRAFT_504807 [Polyporus arcularius HHB13444]
MGGRTKYYTAEDRRLAKLAQARRYRSSPKGKTTKSAANCRQYEQRMQIVAAGLSAGVRLPDLSLFVPGVLLERGARVLRPSWSVYLAPTQPTEPPLMGLWTPPFCYVRVPDRDLASLPIGTNLWNSKAACLGTYQNTEITEAAYVRYDRWVVATEERIAAEVGEELGTRIASWCSLWLSEQRARSPDEVKQVALDWGAKVVCLLLTEWECRVHEGAKGYEEARTLGRLPWQAMGKASRRLFDAEM